MDPYTSEVVEAYRKTESAVANEYANVPDKELLTQKILDKFLHAFKEPPIQDFEFVLQRKISPDEIRLALFDPTDSHQIDVYIRFLAITAEMPSSHQLVKTKSTLFTLLYLVHRKRWSFLSRFILQGGLIELIPFLGDPNLYSRGQAIEIFMSVTDCDEFDWFKVDGLSREDKALHHRLLELKETAFLANICQNRTGSYPGGSQRALQILAFWLSWVRALYTKDGILSLSSGLLSEIENWGTASDHAEDTESDERSLAKTLHEDFFLRQFQQDGSNEQESELSERKRIDGPGNAVKALESERLALSVEGVDLIAEKSLSSDFAMLSMQQFPQNAPQDAVKVLTLTNVHTNSGDPDNQSIIGAKGDTASSDGEGIEHALALRETAKDLFVKGLFKESLECYNRILVILDDADTSRRNTSQKSTDDSDILDLQAAIHFNTAAVFWKLYSLQNPEMLTECLEACKETLARKPLHKKALFRLATVLKIQGKPEEAIAVLDEYKINNANSPAQSAASESDQEQAIKDLRRECVAAALLLQKGAHDESFLIPDHKTGRLLQALQQRRQREAQRVTHAWVDWQPPAEEDAENDNLAQRSVEVEVALEADVGLSPAGVPSDREEIKEKSSKLKEVTGAGTVSGLQQESGELKTSGKEPKVVKATVKVPKVSREAVSLLAQLKKQAAQLEKGVGVGVVVENASQTLRQLYGTGVKLRKVVAASLEESLLIILVTIAARSCQAGDQEFAFKVFADLMSCERFDSALLMAECGNAALGADLRLLVRAAVQSAPPPIKEAVVEKLSRFSS